MNFKNKLLNLLLFTLFIIPNFVFAYSNQVVLGGDSIGIEVKSTYITIVGFYKVENKYIAKEAGFQIGDKVLKVNGEEIDDIHDMTNSIQEKNNTITVLRDEKEKDIKLKKNEKEK